MSSPVTQRPRARLDLLEQFVYFGEEASPNWPNATSAPFMQPVSNWSIVLTAELYTTPALRA